MFQGFQNMSPMERMAAGGVGGGMLAGGLFNMFGDNKNPSDAASPYLDKLSSTITPYYTPFMQNSQQVSSPLIQQYLQLMQNPSAVMSNMGQGYQQSPGYQFQLNQGMNASNNAAAAGGMLGSPMHQQQSAQMAEGLANQDYYGYLKNAMGLYGQGLEGAGGIYNTGFSAAQGLSSGLANALLSQAMNAYQGANTQNQQDAGGLAGLFSGIGALASFL